MEPSDNLSYCYNKGCGQRFDPNANAPDSCRHHPGVPVFHDAYKSWSCCQKKKTTDFTEFLGIPGCTTACHNGQKPPPEELKCLIKNEDAEEEERKNALALQRMKINTLSVKERPDPTLPTVNLHFAVTPSLKTLLLQEDTPEEKTNGEETDSSKVLQGTSCKNGGCRKTFQYEVDNTEECLYHPGVPVFHEGLKFWSCCVRRTSDFNCFLDQLGCTSGLHLWFKPTNPTEDNKTSCRYDWYQTGPHVFISVYAKKPLPSQSSVRANQVVLNVNLSFGDGCLFVLDLDLYGVIDVGSSEVTYGPNKVEIKLKKGEPTNWVKLVMPQSKTNKS